MLIIFAILGIVILTFFVVSIRKTSLLNADPAQHILAAQIVNAATTKSPFEREKIISMAIEISSLDARLSATTRLAHALTLTRPMISDRDYEDIRMMSRSIAKMGV